MKILVALDYSKSVNMIAQKANEMAEAFQADIILLHVLSDITYYSSLNYSPITGFDSFSTMDMVQESTIEEVKKAAYSFLDKIAGSFKTSKIEKVVREGDFADEILNACNESEAKMIIMGTHSRRGIDKIFMGSVAEAVLHKSEVPVYVIPVRDKKD